LTDFVKEFILIQNIFSKQKNANKINRFLFQVF